MSKINDEQYVPIRVDVDVAVYVVGLIHQHTALHEGSEETLVATKVPGLRCGGKLHVVLNA